MFLTCNGEARDHVIFWQGKDKLLGVVVVVLNIDELQRQEALVATCEGLLFTGCFCVHAALVAEISVAKNTGPYSAS